MYEQYYKLRAKPFRLSPDPGFFFASRGHKRALAYLRYGLSQSEGFVVITGEPGTGKTTLAQILLKEMGKSNVVVAHLTTTQLESDDLLRMVVAAYGLRFEGLDKTGLLKTLESFLIARSRENKRALLVVDEAQNLPPRSLEELRMLSNLQVGDHALLQTFLLGQVQFRQKLDHPDLEQLRQRVIANYHLSPLAEDECKSYVETRLQAVGWKDDPHFTEEAYKIIFNYTGGIPRRINMFCDRVLLFSCLEERHTIDEDVLREVTNELQGEVSGRPIQKPVLTDDTPEFEGVALDGDEITAGGEEMTTAAGNDPAEDMLQELESKVSDPIESAAPRSNHKSKQPTSPAEGRRERGAEHGRSQSAAKIKPDPVEMEADEAAADKSAEKERFRVIAGGRHPEANPNVEVMAPIPDAEDDSEEATLRKMLRLVLAFHRSPRSFPGLDNPMQPLPKGIRQILTLAVADDDTIKGLRQIAAMGISPPMLRAATRFFVRRVMLVDGADDYRIMGLVAGAGLAEIETHYALLMRLLRQDSQDADDSGINLVGKAYERLCRPELSTDPRAAKEEPSRDQQPDDTPDLDLSPAAADFAAGGRRIAGETPAGQPAAIPVIAGAVKSNKMRIILLITGLVLIGLVVFMTQLTKLAGSLLPDSVVSGAVTQAPAGEAAMPIMPTGETQVGNPGDGVKLTDMATSSAAESGSDKLAGNEQIVATLQAKADAAALARQEAEAKAEARKLELERLKQVETARLAQEAAARQVAEDQAKTKALELERLQADMERINNARARAEAQASIEAKARAEAELRANQEAEIRARKEEEAKTAERRRIEAEQRAKQAEELARQTAELEKQAQARAQAAIMEKSQLLSEMDKSKALVAVTVNEPVSVQSAEESGKISQSDLVQMLQRFQAAYVTGDVQALVRLFANTARTNDHTDLEGIRKEYQTLFEITSQHSFKFSDVTWVQDENYARGSGRYSLTTTGKANQGSTSKAGDIVMQLERIGGVLQFTRFYLTEGASGQ